MSAQIQESSLSKFFPIPTPNRISISTELYPDGQQLIAVMSDLIEEDEKMVNITLRTIGPSPRSRLSLPSTLKVEELRKLIAGTTHLPLENMTLVFRGNVLHDSTNGEDSLVQLHEGDTVTVAIKPKPPAKHIQDNFDDDDGEDLKFQLPESTSRWKRKLFFTLRDKIKLPNMLLMAIFSLRTKTWAAILIWFILAPFAHRLDIGPLYILGTGFLIIFYNLGHRQPGDVSAYSVFNEDFRELPGTLNADRLDRDIRLGQL